MHKILSTIALLITVCLAGCGGGGSSSASGTSNTIRGVVRVPSSVAHSHVSIRADLGGVSPSAGVTVELVSLDAQGNVVSVLASTTTDVSGAYTFTGNYTPGSALAVRVPGQPTLIPPTNDERAIVTSTQVDISPISEAVTAALIQNIAGSGGSVTLSNFTTQEVIALNNLLRGMGIDVSGATTFDEAVTTIQGAAGAMLASLTDAYASTSSSSVVFHTHLYNSVSIGDTLEDPYTNTLNGTGLGGIRLITGSSSSGEFFDTNETMVEGDLEINSASILHNLSSTTPSISQSPPGASTSLKGLTHAINAHGQLIVWDSAGNGALGAVTADGSLLVYPLTSDTPSGQAFRGIRIATMGIIPPGTSGSPGFNYTNNTLDQDSTDGLATIYNVVSLSQTLSNPTVINPTGPNTITAATTTGNLAFDSSITTTLTTGGPSGTYASFLPNTLPTDPLILDFSTHTVSNPSVPNISLGGSSGGHYIVNHFGDLNFSDEPPAFLGAGAVTPNGEIFTFTQTPNDDGSQAATDGIGTHALTIAIRQPGSTITLSAGTYNVVQYAVFLAGDGTAATADSGYKVGTLTFDGTGVVTNGNFISRRASLDIPAAQAAIGNALSAPSPTSETMGSGDSGNITAPNTDGTTTLTLTIGTTTVTGTGAVTLDGGFIALAIKIVDTSTTPSKEGRGLMILVRQP